MLLINAELLTSSECFNLICYSCKVYAIRSILFSFFRFLDDLLYTITAISTRAHLSWLSFHC